MRAIHSLFLLGFLVTILLLTACGGSGGSSGPAYSVSTKTLTFTTTIDGAAPDSQDVVFKAASPQNEYPNVAWDTTRVILNAVDQSYPDDKTLVLRVSVIAPLYVGIGTYSTTIEVSNSKYDAVITVNYIINPPPPGTPKVTTVSPFAEVSGEAQSVMIGGSGFSRFSDSNPPQVSFNGIPATSVTVVSDTELRAVHPAMSAGVYPVSVNGADVAFTSTANLKVFNYPQFSTDKIASSGIKSKLVFDAERSALYVANQETQQIERYRFINSVWKLDTLALAGLQDITLTADGLELIAIDNYNFYKVDISGNTLSSTFSTTLPTNGIDTTKMEQVTFTGSGNIVSTGKNSPSDIYIYNPISHSVQNLIDASHIRSFIIWSPILWTSWDGSRLYLTETGTSANRSYILDGGTLQTSVFETRIDYNYVKDFTADRSGNINIENAEYVSDIHRGFLANLGVSGDIAAISPNGNTVYVYTQSTGVLKVETPALNNNIGTVGLDNVITNNPGSNPLLTLSLDGKTLFFADSNSVMILPVNSLK